MVDRKNLIINLYIVLASLLAVACIVFYFFPFFNFKRNDGVECQYSGFDLTCSMFVSENNISDTDDDFVEKTMMLELKAEDKSSTLIWVSMATITAGVALMVLALIFTIFNKGKILETFCSILSLISFVGTVVCLRMLIGTMNEIVDSTLLIGRYNIEYALYVTIVLNIAFVVTNFIRQDRSKKLYD